MRSKTELKLFKDLKEESSISTLAEKSGLHVSTVSKYISQSLKEGNGLFEKRKLFTRHPAVPWRSGLNSWIVISLSWDPPVPFFLPG